MNTSIKIKLTNNLKSIPIKTRFKNKDGSLTSYALACGYLQEEILTEANHIRLLQDGCFHVKGRAHDRFFWLCFNNLTEARAYYAAKLKVMKIELKELAEGRNIV